MIDLGDTILDLVVEDDYGLWEVVWRVMSTQPMISEAKAIEAAVKTIAEMYEQGLVVLERRNADALALVPGKEVRAVLSDPDSWKDAQIENVGVFIRATASGEDVYYSRRS